MALQLAQTPLPVPPNVPSPPKYPSLSCYSPTSIHTSEKNTLHFTHFYLLNALHTSVSRHFLSIPAPYSTAPTSAANSSNLGPIPITHPLHPIRISPECPHHRGSCCSLPDPLLTGPPSSGLPVQPWHPPASPTHLLARPCLPVPHRSPEASGPPLTHTPRASTPSISLTIIRDSP